MKQKKLSSRKNIEIDNDILEWLADEYEGYSIWTLVNKLLRAFMEAHKTNGRLPTLIKKAARTTLQEINQ